MFPHPDTPTDDLSGHLENLLQHAEQVRILAAHLALDQPIHIARLGKR